MNFRKLVSLLLALALSASATATASNATGFSRWDFRFINSSEVHRVEIDHTNHYARLVGAPIPTFVEVGGTLSKEMASRYRDLGGDGENYIPFELPLHKSGQGVVLGLATAGVVIGLVSLGIQVFDPFDANGDFCDITINTSVGQAAARAAECPVQTVVHTNLNGQIQICQTNLPEFQSSFVGGCGQQATFVSCTGRQCSRPN